MTDAHTPKLRYIDLAGKLPWRIPVAPGVIQNDDRSLQMTFQLTGPDLSGTSQEVRGSRMLQANNAVRRLGRGSALYVEARRTQVSAAEYPVETFAHPVARRANDERRAAFLTHGRHFRSQYFLTLRYQPPSTKASQLESFFKVGQSPLEDASDAATIRTFRAQSVHLANLLGGASHLTPLTDADTRTYLHSTISWKSHRVAVSDLRSDMHLRMVDCDLQQGFHLRLGPRWLYVVSITDLPDRSLAGLLTALDDAAFEYRWCTRYIALPKARARATMHQIRRQHFGQRLSFGQRIAMALGKQPSPLQNTDAVNKSNAVDEAMQEMGADLTGFGYFSDVVVIWDDDANAAYEKAKLVEELINDRECSCQIEGLNAEEAWYGSLPGNVKHNLRRPMESSLNRVHTLPGLMQTWTGLPRDDHLNAPALLHATTAQATPFHISLHPRHSDVGNAAVLGPMGKGKTVLLASMMLNWTKYPGYQIRAFDVKRGLRGPTLCLGGLHIDLGKVGPCLQPLGDLDTDFAFRRAETWGHDRMDEAHLPLTAERRSYLRVGLQALRQLPRSARTISQLIEEWKIFTGEMVRPGLNSVRRPRNEDSLRARVDIHEEMQEVFRPFCGGLLDGTSDLLLDNPVICFEWESLLEDPKLIAPTVSHLWPHLEDGFQGQPTLFLCDEFNRLMTHRLMVERVDKALRLYRFRNVAFVASTQFVEDILDERIGSMLQQSCPTRFLLPNPAALSRLPRDAYTALEVTEAQLSIIAQAREKEECFLMSPDGARLFRYRLEGTALDVCGRATLADQQLMTEVLAQHGREDFWQGWLAAVHAPEHVDVSDDAWADAVAVD